MVLLPLLSYIGLVNVEEVWDKQPTLEVGVVQGVAEVADPFLGLVDLCVASSDLERACLS